MKTIYLLWFVIIKEYNYLTVYYALDIYIFSISNRILNQDSERIPALCVNLTTWLKVEIFKRMRRQS